jgi:hypothetical protein
MAKLGYLVLRFTGKEIVRDPVWCARHVIEYISEKYGRADYQTGLAYYLEGTKYDEDTDMLY